MSKNVILVGGMPTVGKSTLARALSAHLNLPWISTDQIREIMRSVADKDKYPNLFNSMGYSAERFLTEFSVQQIVDMEFAQSEATWLGVSTFIRDDYSWIDGFIVEGVGIPPSLYSRDFKDDRRKKVVFLGDDDIDRVQGVVFNRGLWDKAEAYSDELKEKEVEWVIHFSQLLKAKVNEFGYPWVDIQKNDNDLPNVLDALGL